MEEWDIDLNVPITESDDIRKRAPELFFVHYQTERSYSTLCGMQSYYRPSSMWSEVDCPDCLAKRQWIYVVLPGSIRPPLRCAPLNLPWAHAMAEMHPDWIFYYEE